MGAFYSKVYSQEEENVFRFYSYQDLSEEAPFTEFAANVQQAALYDTSVIPVFGDEILVLVTCSSHTEEGRFVVVARWKQQAE